MKSKRRQGGFTLLEVLVAMAILVILLGGILSAVQPAFRFFEQTNRQTQAESIANTVMEAITGRVEYASSVILTDAPPSSGQLALEFDSGKLYVYDNMGRKALFDDGFYKDMAVEVVPSGAGGTQLTVTITVKEGGEVLHKSTNALNLQNLPFNTEEEKRNIQGMGKRYLIYMKGEALSAS